MCGVTAAVGAAIPTHITALYVFAVINLIALLNISLVEADIRVLDADNVTLESVPDMPAQFGPGFPVEGMWGHLVMAEPRDGCTKMHKAPPGGNSIAVIARGNNCNFDTKVYNAQNASFIAAVVYNIDSDDLIPMGRSGDKRVIQTPSCFIGWTDGSYLIKHHTSLETFVVIDNRTPFNFNLNYLVPFAIVVGICFVLMVVFMVARWVLDYRRRRKSRLSKDALKKIPIKKFKKGDHYDVCAICLDEYDEGEKLRVLPCSHAYHMKCIDPWLTKSKRNCPVCKRKVIPGDDSDDSDTEEESEGTGENTPLLNPSNSAMNSQLNDNYARSGLPSSMRGAGVVMSSDSDTDSSDMIASGSYQAQVHVSPRRTPLSYGATARAPDRLSASGSRSSSRSASRASAGSPASRASAGSPASSRDGYESIDGATGNDPAYNDEAGENVESTVEVPDDRYHGDDNEMSGLITDGEESNTSGNLLVRILGRKSPKQRANDDEA